MKTIALFTVLLVLLALTISTGLCKRYKSAKTVAAVAVPAPPPLIGRIHRMRAARAGRVWEVYAISGEQVQRGQLLAKIAIPLRSVEKQQREAEFQRVKHEYALLIKKNAPQAELAQARLRLAEAGHRLVEAPALYTFVFVEAASSGTITGPAVRPGQYLTDSSTVAVIAEPVPEKAAHTLADN